MDFSAFVAAFNRLSSPLCSLLVRYGSFLRRVLLVLSLLVLPLVFIPGSIESTGSAALAILWFVLFVPIFSKVFRVRLFSVLMGFRKELGILMGVLAAVHSAAYFVTPSHHAPLPIPIWKAEFWIGQDGITYLAFGFVATFFALLLLMTSNAFSMKAMGHKRWKLVHRTAYVVLIFTVLHVVVLEYAKHGRIEIGPIAVLTVYFLGKILEWKGISFAKNAA